MQLKISLPDKEYATLVERASQMHIPVATLARSYVLARIPLDAQPAPTLPPTLEYDDNDPNTYPVLAEPPVVSKAVKEWERRRFKYFHARVDDQTYDIRQIDHDMALWDMENRKPSK